MNIELTSGELNAAEDRLIRHRKKMAKMTEEELRAKTEEVEIELEAVLWRLTHPGASV